MAYNMASSANKIDKPEGPSSVNSPFQTDIAAVPFVNTDVVGAASTAAVITDCKTDCTTVGITETNITAGITYDTAVLGIITEKDTASGKASVIDTAATPENKQVDVFRDTWIRYIGYTNEVGESFRNLIRVKYVYLSYGISTIYALADSSTKAVDEYEYWEGLTEKSKRRRAIEMFVGGMVWQGLASVIFPGFAINRICKVTKLLLNRTASSRLSTNLINYTTTGVGLACVPLIIKPIDKFTDTVMEKGISVASYYVDLELEEQYHDIYS